MPYAGVNGQRLYYEVGGDGETVVLLHGAFVSADIMEAPATGLASGFRALRLDRRGHGRSNPVDGPVSLADEAADVTALLDWFGAPNAHFLAHDDGAEVALQFALTHPERTLSLALIAPTFEGYPWSPEAALAHADMLAAIRQNPRKAIEEKWLTSSLFDVAKEHEGMFDRIADMFRKCDGTFYKFDRPPHDGPPQARRLGEIKARSAILAGGRDESERLKCAEAIADGIEGSELITFPGLSRFLHIEESRSVMRRLTDFYIPEPDIER